MRAVVKVIATGASIVMGTVFSEAIEKTPIGSIPVVGEIVQTFCGTFVTGIMSCSLLYFLDRSETINKLVSKLDRLDILNTGASYYIKQAKYLDKYAAELMSIDINKFREETDLYYSFALEIENVKSEDELNIKLKNILNNIEVNMPWNGEFDDFMSDKNNRLVFE